MDFTKTRSLLLKVFLGFLALTALIAIFSVLAGEFGELQGKILATTITITIASICSMSCAAFIERKKLAQLGLCGIVISVCAAVLLIAGLWFDIDSEGYWMTTVTFVIFAIAFAHALLLSLPELDDKQKWIQKVSSASIGVLAVLISVAVWGEIHREEYYRFLAVVGIVVGLETLAIPLLLRLRKANGQGSKSLLLERIREDVYRDADGKIYQLREIVTEHGAAQDGESAGRMV